MTEPAEDILGIADPFAAVQARERAFQKHLKKVGKKAGKIEERMKCLVHRALQVVFERHPAVSKIVWEQYTDYFNDGDPCEFGLEQIYFTYDGHAWSAYEHPADGYTHNDVADHIAYGYKDALKTADIARDALPREFYLAAFGDHTRIEITPEALIVSAYEEHD